MRCFICNAPLRPNQEPRATCHEKLRERNAILLEKYQRLRKAAEAVIEYAEGSGFFWSDTLEALRAALEKS